MEYVRVGSGLRNAFLLLCAGALTIVSEAGAVSFLRDDTRLALRVVEPIDPLPVPMPVWNPVDALRVRGLWLQLLERSHPGLLASERALPIPMKSNAAGFVAGTGRSPLGDEAFIWSETSGRQWLGDLSGGRHASRAVGLSADGGTVIGVSESERGSEAFVWTEEAGMIGLGRLEGTDESYALAVSADGRTVLGYCSLLDGGYARAFVWQAEHGMRGLVGAIQEGGGGSAAVHSLRWALDMLDERGPLHDGAFALPVQSQAALVPEPSTGVLLGCALGVLSRLGVRSRRSPRPASEESR